MLLHFLPCGTEYANLNSVCHRLKTHFSRRDAKSIFSLALEGPRGLLWRVSTARANYQRIFHLFPCIFGVGNGSPARWGRDFHRKGFSLFRSAGRIPSFRCLASIESNIRDAMGCHAGQQILPVDPEKSHEQAENHCCWPLPYMMPECESNR